MSEEKLSAFSESKFSSDSEYPQTGVYSKSAPEDVEYNKEPTTYSESEVYSDSASEPYYKGEGKPYSYPETGGYSNSANENYDHSKDLKSSVYSESGSAYPGSASQNPDHGKVEKPSTEHPGGSSACSDSTEFEEDKPHKYLERTAEFGTAGAGAYSLYEKNKEGKDTEHGGRRRMEEEAASAAVGVTGEYEKERKEEDQEGHGKKQHHLF